MSAPTRQPSAVVVTRSHKRRNQMLAKERDRVGTVDDRAELAVHAALFVLFSAALALSTSQFFSLGADMSFRAADPPHPAQNVRDLNSRPHATPSCRDTACGQ
jgi:hypothetical protein